MCDDLPELVAHSLDAPVELLRHLPELFEGLEDLGARASDVVAIVSETDLDRDAKVLDLGCGKGASALALARAFGVQVRGIDGMPAFVAHATARATREGLSDRCRFVVGDVRTAVHDERGYDLVMMLALGDLLGPLPSTLRSLTDCVHASGYVLLDDAFLADGTPASDADGVYDRATTLRMIERAGMKVVGERTTDTAEARAWLQDATALILSRAEAVAAREPQLAPQLHEFARRQFEETQADSGPLVGVTWLLQRR